MYAPCAASVSACVGFRPSHEGYDAAAPPRVCAAAGAVALIAASANRRGNRCVARIGITSGGITLLHSFCGFLAKKLRRAEQPRERRRPLCERHRREDE